MVGVAVWRACPYAGGLPFGYFLHSWSLSEGALTAQRAEHGAKACALLRRRRAPLQGINVRNRAKELCALLANPDRIREERAKARANKEKYRGLSKAELAGVGVGGDAGGCRGLVPCVWKRGRQQRRRVALSGMGKLIVCGIGRRGCAVLLVQSGAEHSLQGEEEIAFAACGGAGGAAGGYEAVDRQGSQLQGQGSIGGDRGGYEDSGRRLQSAQVRLCVGTLVRLLLVLLKALVSRGRTVGGAQVEKQLILDIASAAGRRPGGG